MFEWANLARVFGILGITNGGTGASTASGARTNLDVYSKSETDVLVSGLLDLRGSFDASGGGYPTTGGSGTAGAILKGDSWKISVSGAIGQLNDVVYALVDSPAQTAGNWEVIEGNLNESSFGFFSNSLTSKTTPVDADSINIVDSADSNKSKKVSLTNFKAFFKTYFDTLYLSLSPATVVVSGTTKTLAASDNGKLLIFTNAAGCAVTLPEQSNVALPEGFTCDYEQQGAVKLTFAKEGTDTITSGSNTEADFGAKGTIRKPTSTSYSIEGGTEVCGWEEKLTVATVANQRYNVIKLNFIGILTEVSTIARSGTCTATTDLATVTVTGTANSVSTSDNTQAITALNTFTAGTYLGVTLSANSSCLDADITFKGTYRRNV